MAVALIGFGFWHSMFEPLLPDPAWFVDEQWPPAVRQEVLAYLRQGRELNPWMGYSWCRFGCGVHDSLMGGWDVTDGTLCWPEGLAHYIEKHQLRLPDAIVQHIFDNQPFPEGKAALAVKFGDVDMSWWQAQRGWQTAARTLPVRNFEEAKNWVRRYDRGQLELNPEPEAATQAREQMINKLRELLA